MSVTNNPDQHTQVPEGDNDPKEAINSPEEVEESNDEKIDQDFPGYPHYPAKDDILNPDNDTTQVDVDVENLTRSNTVSQTNLKNSQRTSNDETDYTQVDVEDAHDLGFDNNPADITAEDLAALGDKNEDMDMGEDEELNQRGYIPITGKDLDVPNADPDNQPIEESDDEENSYYSLGGDDMQNLEENDDQNNF